MRLDRLIGGAVSSRSKARALIAEGRVRVNGAPVKNGACNVCESDAVTLDGAPIGRRGTLHLMLHKPADCVTARRDARFATVLTCSRRRYAPAARLAVGRLDRDVTGLLLFTRTGSWPTG